VNIVDQFPPHWRVDVTVNRSGGTDPRGNPLPGSSHIVKGCLVTTQATEAEARTDLPDTQAYIYAETGADFAPGDRVTVPEGAGRLWPWGRFVVNGDVGYTPLGTRAQLRRV